MKKVILYSDGSARGNPEGPGGYGTVLLYTSPGGKEYRKEYAQGYIRTTNNRMELMGVICGLEALTEPCEVTVYSDSQYVIKAFRDRWIDGWKKRGWKTSSGGSVKNRDLWERLLQAASPHQITWNWVRGHQGNPGNERCDTLATSAADSGNLIPDPGVQDS